MLLTPAFFAAARRALPATVRLAVLAMARLAFLQPLRKTNRRADEIESGAHAIFKKPLIAEVQRLRLVREQHESGRSGRRLRDVIDFHLAARGRGSAIEVH